MSALHRDWNQFYADGDTPWDFNRPSAELMKLLEQFAPPTSAAVLEVGCGTGSNAVYLAQQGYDVTAVDVAPLAIEKAIRRANDAGVKVNFQVADLLQPPAALLGSAGEGGFSLLFDRGVYHILRRLDLFGYLKTLEQVTAPGSLYLMLTGNANDPETGSEGPPRVHDYELCHEMAPLFELVQLREFHFDGVIGNQKTPPLGWSAVFRRRLH